MGKNGPVSATDPTVPGTFVEAVISPVVCGVVRLWAPSGSALLTVRDPEGLAAVLGRARVPRTRVGEENAYRETVTVNLEAGLLGVTGRFGVEGEVDVRLFDVAPSTARPAGDPWGDLAGWLADVIPGAAERGEYVTLEPGDDSARPPGPHVGVGVGDDSGQPRHVSFSVTEHDSARIVLLEATPGPPAELPLWDGATRSGTGAQLAFPASRRTVHAVPALLVAALAPWANPWRLVATFGSQPAGPFLLADA